MTASWAQAAAERIEAEGRALTAAEAREVYVKYRGSFGGVHTLIGAVIAERHSGN